MIEKYKGKVKVVDQKLSNVSLALFHNGVSVGVFRPAYIGMLGIFFEKCDINYPNGTPLEIKILQPNNNGIDSQRIPVSVSCITNSGIGLRFDHYNPFHNGRWKMLLNNIMSQQKGHEKNKLSSV